MNVSPASDATDLVLAQSAIEKLTRSAGKSDLDDLLRGARRSLLLIDCSGSMKEPIRQGGRKIDALRAEVSRVRDLKPVPIAAFGAFGAAVQVVDTVPEPSGMTPLHLAIEFGQSQGATHLVVVTDGIPDSRERAFAAARAFGYPIDVFYVGDGQDGGAQFAADLAKLTGGTVNLTELGKPKELSGKIVLMLGDGN